MRTPEEISAYQREYRLKHAQQKKEYQKEYQKKWYQKNKTIKDQKNREWDKKNIEKRKEISKRYREKYPERVTQRSKQYLELHSEERKKTITKYNDANVEKLRGIAFKYNHSLDGIYRRYISTAKKRSILFELDKVEFFTLIESSCIYCGGLDRIGVDRVDNNIGYTIQNSVPCCHFCNRMKWVHSKKDFLAHVLKIAHHNNML